jgi:ABC-type multidrug transport system ATPase subunit
VNSVASNAINQSGEGQKSMNNVVEAGCALELRDLRKSFGKTEIIRGANLAVKAGERVGIIGPNGAGKSTLFNLISGRFEPTSGDVLLNGHRINGKSHSRSTAGFVPQLPDHQYFSQAQRV